MRDKLGARAEAFRSGGLVGLDIVATLCGVCGAFLLTGTSIRDVGSTREFILATALLVFLRVAFVMAAQLHRWSFWDEGWRELLLLVGAMFAATVVFAVSTQTFPVFVYAYELELTTALMAGTRFSRRLKRAMRRAIRDSSACVDAIRGERPRRVLNVIVAATALLLTLPIWIAIALAIKLTSRGPVFYQQERVGLDRRSTDPLSHDARRKRDLGGRPFMMYKFRTMRVDAEAATGAVWSSKNDPRVTRVGRILRHTRLDELPQLVNVLKGDMNIVGPRPERPSIFAELRTKIPNYQHRQRVRPGITGYAQVNLEYDATLDDVANKVKYDLDYVSRQSLTADLYIMAKTVPVMLFRERMLSSRPRAPRAAPPLRALGAEARLHDSQLH